MSPDTTRRLPAPFAAVVRFKQGQFWQDRFPSFTFRSDDLSPDPCPFPQQYRHLEQFVLKELHGTYLTASMFDNCGLLNRIPPDDHEALRSRNLVWQFEYMRFKIDKRQYLDLSFLDHTFSPEYLYRLGESFAKTHYPDSPLRQAAQQYRQTFNL